MSKCLRRVRKMFGVLEEVDVLRLRCVLACVPLYVKPKRMKFS